MTIQMTSKALIALTTIMLTGCAGLLELAIPLNDVPGPTGPSAVGTRTFFLTDEERAETYTKDPSDRRRIVVQAWYPTEDTSGQTAPYLDFFGLRAGPIAYQLGVDERLLQNIGKIGTGSIIDAGIGGQGMLPLIVFSHGLGGFRVQNTIQFQELASRGYLVMSIDHPYDAHLTVFQDSTLADFRAEDQNNLTGDAFYEHWAPKIDARAQDVSFLLDWASEINKDPESDFFGRIDPERVGMFGHSFGGGTSIYAMWTDPRIKAAAALDGWVVPVPEKVVQSGVDRPLLYIGRENWSGPYNLYVLQKIANTSTGPVYISFVDGMKHFDYADIPHLSDRAHIFRFTGSRDKGSMLSIVNESLLDFFGHHLDSLEPMPEGRPRGLSDTDLRRYAR